MGVGSLMVSFEVSSILFEFFFFFLELCDWVFGRGS